MPTRIMIVENDVVIASDLQRRAEQLGFTVTANVTSTEAALENVEADPPDIVIIDITLEGETNGLQTAEEIRSRWQIPVLFTLAAADQERLDWAKLPSPFGYLLKPFQDRDIKITIDMALHVAQVDRERRPEEEKASFLGRVLRQTVSSVITTNKIFEISWTNLAFEKLYGFTQEEVIGSTPDFLNAEPLSELIQRDIYDTVSSGKVWRGEALNKRKDGSLFPCEMEIFPLLGEDGEVIAYSSQQRDVTERKRVEEIALLFNRVLERSLNEIYIFDAETFSLIDVNRGARENLGYSIEELHALTPMDLKPEFTPEAFAKLVAPLVAQEQEKIEFTTVHVRKDGTCYPVEVHLELMTGGTPVFVAFILDITERERAEEERRQFEEQMQHTQKLESLGVLAGGIAHDFNNLLMTVLGNADLMLDVLPQASPARDDLEGIVIATKRASELATQMLAYSGRGAFELVPIDLSALVEEMSHLLETSIAKKVDLRLDLTRDLPAVKADATQLRQVVMNLIINGSEAIGEASGSISVSTGTRECDPTFLESTYVDDQLPEGNYVYVEVTDTGCGMDCKTSAKIFEPFFSTKFTGRGLGLAALLGIVRGHKGAVRVESEPGGGTTLTVLLPTCTEQVACVASGQGSEHWLGSGTLLLVDDEETVRSVVRKMLVKLGFEVLMANDGIEAVEIFRENVDEIALVLLDMKMPRMDGVTAFAEIRSIRGDARVILSSGYTEEQATETFAGKGLVGFIQKPYRLVKLRDVLQRVFAVPTS